MAAIKIEDLVKTTRPLFYELDDGQHFELAVGTPGVVYNLDKKVARVEIRTADIIDPEAQRALRDLESIYTEIALEALEVAEVGRSVPPTPVPSV